MGCDYHKIATPELREQYLEPMRPTFEVPQMSQTQRIPHYLEALGLSVADIDAGPVVGSYASAPSAVLRQDEA